MDVFLLTFFRSAANQDYKPVPVFAEVNPVAWTKINPVLVNTGSNALGVGQIALLDARQSSRHLGRRFSVQTVEPSGIRTASAPVKVFAYFDHG
jgi:hypothetical protein